MFKVEFKQDFIEMLPVEASAVHRDGDFFIFTQDDGVLAAMVSADCVLTIGAVKEAVK